MQIPSSRLQLTMALFSSSATWRQETVSGRPPWHGPKMFAGWEVARKGPCSCGGRRAVDQRQNDQA